MTKSEDGFHSKELGRVCPDERIEEVDRLLVGFKNSFETLVSRKREEKTLWIRQGRIQRLMLPPKRNTVQLERHVVSSFVTLEGTMEADSDGLHVNVVHEALVGPFICPIRCLDLYSVA